MRHRRRLLLVEPRRALEQIGAHGGFREAAKRDELAAGEDRLGQLPEVVGDEHDDRVLGRLLEVLEQRIRRGLVHRVRLEDQVHAARRLERAHVQVAPQRADLVDQHLVADRLEHVQVRVRAALDAARVADQLAGEDGRRAALADPGRAVEEVGVRRPFRERGREKALRLRLLRKALEAHL